MRFNNLRSRVLLIVFVVYILVTVFYTFFQIRYGMHDADEVLEDLSDTREVVIRAYSDDGSYEERTVADPGEVREICDTVLALKMKVTRFKTLKNVVYEVCFVGTDGETIDTLAVAPGNDLVGITETTFRIKSDFDILEYARNLFAAAAAN